MNEWETLIAEHDKTLSHLREAWVEARGKERNKWMKRINEALEHRCDLMKRRDEQINA